MERLGLDPHLKARLEALKAKLVERACAEAAEHAATMASLPAGTCARCYGSLWVDVGHGVERCPTCRPSIVHGDGVPHEFQQASFDNYREESGNHAGLERARQFMDGTRDLYLTGGVGAGKTRLACSILNEWYRKTRGGLFARVPMLLHQLQPGRDAEAVAELEARLFSVPLLVLDDVGAERDMATDYTRRTLLMIYEERGDRGLRTIWTSNKTLQQLGDMQEDDRLASRIAGRSDVVLLKTADQRLA